MKLHSLGLKSELAMIDGDVIKRDAHWDLAETPADLDAFTMAGYHHEKTVVLTATQVRPPPHPNTEIDLRVLSARFSPIAIDLSVAILAAA